MPEDSPYPPRPELSGSDLKKLDGGLRRLLGMSEQDLIERVEIERARMQEKPLRPIDLLPPTASPEEKQAAEGLGRHIPVRAIAHPVFGAVEIDPSKLKPARARAILHFNGNRDDLAALGLVVHSQAQDTFTVEGTLAQLATLAQQPATRRLRLPRLMLPVVENASAQCETADVHIARPANPQGFLGDNVMVGVVDSCLDVTHQGFQNPTGTHGTRVRYYWVQAPWKAVATPSGTTYPHTTPPGQTPAAFHSANPTTTPDFSAFDYGRLYTETDINTALGNSPVYGDGNNQICAVPTSNSEHGTHCAGIAAGSGHVNNWGTAPTHVGAAPHATIVFVALGTGTYEDRAMDGMAFCARAAEFHNMPVSISISQASQIGPHNGDTIFDQNRDALLNSFQNRSIVFAAGNDNDANGYRRGTVAASATETFTLTPQYHFGLTWVQLSIWYPGQELDFQVEYGGVASTWQTAIQELHDNVNGRWVDGDRETDTGLQHILLYFDSAPVGVAWTIRLRNNGSADTPYQAWVGVQSWWGDLSGSTQGEQTIADTACGRAILTVGACDKLNPANAAAGEPIADISGAGPTRDGRIKPELCAVGSNVISTASDLASGYVSKSGTSMATPMAAGSVALLFHELHGNLGLNPNQDTIKALLTTHTNTTGLHLDPAQAGYVPTERNLFGFGRLRMIGPIDHLIPPLSVDVWIRTAADDYGAQPYPGGCFCGAPDIRVFDPATGNETTSLTWGSTYSVHVTVRNLGNDAAVGTKVRLRYTMPWAAPNDWHAAEDASNNPLADTVDIPALSEREVVYQWRPEHSEIPGASGTHFCLLAEADHPLDPLAYNYPATGTSDAWEANIKNTNNVALRNLHLQ